MLWLLLRCDWLSRWSKCRRLSTNMLQVVESFRLEEQTRRSRGILIPSCTWCPACAACACRVVSFNNPVKPSCRGKKYTNKHQVTLLLPQLLLVLLLVFLHSHIWFCSSALDSDHLCPPAPAASDSAHHPSLFSSSPLLAVFCCSGFSPG